MKNFVSVIAALSLMLSAAPAITSYATEAATTPAAAEVSAETTDIEHIAGEWKYQNSDTNLPVNITPTDYGTAKSHLTAQGKANADVNGGGLTVGDAQAIQKALLNK